jgi:uncharacterized membrane protein YfcA
MDHMLILALVFLVISTLFSMLGMGGGILYVPILLFAGFGMSSAPSISLILIAATSLAALTHFSKNKKVDWKLALVIDPPTDVMAFVGGYFSLLIAEPVLRTVLIVVLMVAGTLMLRNRQKAMLPHIGNEHWWLWHREFQGERYTVNLPLVLTATALIGLLSGMLGISGGIIKLPIMVLLCGVPMDIAIATSTVMVAVTALSGIAGHAMHGQVDWRTGLVLAGVAVIGGLIGSRISVAMNKARLKKWFGVAVWIIAIRMAAQLVMK